MFCKHTCHDNHLDSKAAKLSQRKNHEETRESQEHCVTSQQLLSNNIAKAWLQGYYPEYLHCQHLAVQVAKWKDFIGYDIQTAATRKA